MMEIIEASHPDDVSSLWRDFAFQAAFFSASGRASSRAERRLRFTGVIGGAVLRLVRNLVAWRRSLDMPGWFSMRSIERQTFEQSNDWFPAFEETYGDRIG